MLPSMTDLLNKKKYTYCGDQDRRFSFVSYYLSRDDASLYFVEFFYKSGLHYVYPSQNTLDHLIKYPSYWLTPSPEFLEIIKEATES